MKVVKAQMQQALREDRRRVALLKEERWEEQTPTGFDWNEHNDNDKDRE